MPTKTSASARYHVEHKTVGQWEDTEDIRQQDGQVTGQRKVMRDHPNHAHVLTGPKLAEFLSKLTLEHGESVRIERDDDAEPTA